MKLCEFTKRLTCGALDSLLSELYGASASERQKARYLGVAEAFSKAYGDREIEIYSVPGRTELSGNSIALDVISFEFIS